jgi:hypothetical protein
VSLPGPGEPADPPRLPGRLAAVGGNGWAEIAYRVLSPRILIAGELMRLADPAYLTFDTMLPGGIVRFTLPGLPERVYRIVERTSEDPDVYLAEWPD